MVKKFALAAVAAIMLGVGIASSTTPALAGGGSDAEHGRRCTEFPDGTTYCVQTHTSIHRVEGRTHIITIANGRDRYEISQGDQWEKWDQKFHLKTVLRDGEVWNENVRYIVIWEVPGTMCWVEYQIRVVKGEVRVNEYSDGCIAT